QLLQKAGHLPKLLERIHASCSSLSGSSTRSGEGADGVPKPGSASMTWAPRTSTARLTNGSFRASARLLLEREGWFSGSWEAFLALSASPPADSIRTFHPCPVRRRNTSSTRATLAGRWQSSRSEL